MNTTFKISLDVHRVESQVTITAFRGDSGYTIIASLTEDGKPFPISDGSTAIFSGVKPDGNYLYNSCTIENGKIVYDFKKTTPDGETCQTTAAPGTVKCQFKLIGENGGIISAPQFTIVVEDTVYNEQVVKDSVSEATVLTEMIADIQSKLDNNEFKGEKGDQGYTPIKGVDYFTEEEVASIAADIRKSIVDGSEVSY